MTASRSVETRLAELFRHNGIRAMTISSGTGVTAEREISDIRIRFMKAENDPQQDYDIHFKLSDQSQDIGRYLANINTGPEFALKLTAQGQELDRDDLEHKLEQFHEAIVKRIKKIQKEEEIQKIQFEGNTFILYNTTTFRVVKDEGEGRLTIEIINKDKTTEAAKMMANDLADGLYEGAIKPTE